MAELVLREYRDDDLPGVLELLRVCLGERPGYERTPAFFGWKHLEGPFGRSLLYVAEDDGALVGLRAYLRWRFEHPGGRTYEAVRAVDTATHPDARRQGVFSRLTKYANEHAAGAGIDFVFNTPNEQSKPGYLKLGWKVVCRVPPLLRILRPAVAWGGRARIDERASDALWAEAAAALADRSPLGLRTPRNAAYLRWRYAHHPQVVYRPHTRGDVVAVTRRTERGRRHELRVTDLVGPVDHLRPALRSVLRRSGADYASGSFRAGSPEDRVARRAGFVRVTRLGLDLVALPLSPPGELAVDPVSWDLSLGDIEIF